MTMKRKIPKCSRILPTEGLVTACNSFAISAFEKTFVEKRYNLFSHWNRDREGFSMFVRDRSFFMGREGGGDGAVVSGGGSRKFSSLKGGAHPKS